MDVAPPSPEERPQAPRSNDNFVVGEQTPADDLVMALRFFSRLKVGFRPHGRPDLSRMARALPAASLVIGAGPALLLALLLWLQLPALVAAAIATGAMIVVTGGMAEDGLADAADGLFGGATVARRLEILKDSRHGTYGVSALGLLLIIRVGAISAFGNPLACAAAWLGATVLARSAALWLTVALPPARPDGASAAAGRASLNSFGIGLGVAMAIFVVLGWLAVGLLGVVLGAGLSALVAWGWTAVCRKLIGGQTGDLIGALQALVEIAALVGLLLF